MSGDLLYPQQRTMREDLNGPNGPNTESLCKVKQPTLQSHFIPMYCLSFRQLQVDFNPIRMVDTLYGTWVSAGRFSFVQSRRIPWFQGCLLHSKHPLWFVEVFCCGSHSKAILFRGYVTQNRAVYSKFGLGLTSSMFQTADLFQWYTRFLPGKLKLSQQPPASGDLFL